MNEVFDNFIRVLNLTLKVFNNLQVQLTKMAIYPRIPALTIDGEYGQSNAVIHHGKDNTNCLIEVYGQDKYLLMYDSDEEYMEKLEKYLIKCNMGDEK